MVRWLMVGCFFMGSLLAFACAGQFHIDLQQAKFTAGPFEFETQGDDDEWPTDLVEIHQEVSDGGLGSSSGGPDIRGGSDRAIGVQQLHERQSVGPHAEDDEEEAPMGSERLESGGVESDIVCGGEARHWACSQALRL